MTSAATADPTHTAHGRPPSAAAPRFSRLGAMWSLYTLTLRQHLHGQRWFVLALLFLLPVGLAILIRVTASDVPSAMIEFSLAFFLIPHALLPLIALIYASGIIRDEQEEQTITYLLVRPISKWMMYLVKLLATTTTAVVLTVILTVITYAAIYAGASSALTDAARRGLVAAGIHSLAVVAYCSLFGLMSLLTNRILIAGVLYTAIVEGLLANLPFGIRLLTVIYYARLIAFRALGFVVTLPGGRTENIAAEVWQFDLRNDPQLLEHPGHTTCYIVLTAATVVCAFLAAWLCSQREFHVKTPESE
jgi:ABC-2 type transport system permease protein